MRRKGRHYSLKNSLLMQKTDTGSERNPSYPRHKAPEKGSDKIKGKNGFEYPQTSKEPEQPGNCPTEKCFFVK